MSQRPKEFQNKAIVNGMSMDRIVAFITLKNTLEKGAKEEAGNSLKESKQKTVKFKAQEDNGRSKLHKARFEPLPTVHPKKYFRKIPQTRPYIKNRALGYSGLENVVSDLTLKKLHNRCIATKLKFFFSGNLNISSKQTEIRKVKEGRIETSFDYSWTDPSTIAHVQEALINYTSLLQNIWPQDCTAVMFLRLLIKYKWLIRADESRRPELITKLFDNIMVANAGRACNKEAPMSFQQQEEALKAILTANNVRPEVPMNDIGNKSQAQNNGRNQGQQNRALPSKANSKFAKSKDGRGLCYGFNDANGNVCRNTASGNGCKRQDGLQFAHLCNYFDQKKRDYCMGSHPRKQHR